MHKAYSPVPFARLVIIGVGILSTAACRQGDFPAEKKFANGCWPLSDTLSFVYQNPAAGQAFQPTVSVDFQEGYDYQNIHLKVIAVAPSGKREEALVEGEALDEAGNWRAEQRGSSHAAAYPVKKPFVLQEKGTYTIQLLHNMRDTSLCQVKWVGISDH